MVDSWIYFEALLGFDQKQLGAIPILDTGCTNQDYQQ
jgi:hypothetical protein